MKPYIISVLCACFVAALPVTGQNKLPVIASFATSVADQDVSVKKNIALAGAKINGFVLTPGAVFSFNDIVGEGSAKNGFADGRVMYRDYIAYEPGGGICQVSSTLFNAFLLAGCRIVERHRHFQPVTYVPAGLDATIKYGKKNLRMKNPYPFNLYIESVMNDATLSCVIRADNAIPYRYYIHTDEEELNIPFANEESVRNGLVIYVYRKKTKDSRFIEDFLLYKDYYPPVRVSE